MASFEKRIDASGAVSYRARVRRKGYPPQTATFPRLTDAKRWAAATETAVVEGRHFAASASKRHTLADLIDRYCREVAPGKKAGAYQARQLAWWRAKIGHVTLDRCTPDLVAECRDILVTEPSPPKTANPATAGPARYRSPATIVRYLAALSHAFTIAVKEWRWIDDNPCLKVSKPKEPRGRVRFLADEERERLLTACRASGNPALYPAVVLALATGARYSEILGLRWPAVDLARRVAVLHETKNGERRVLPLSGPALAILVERAKVRRIDTDLVFPGHTRAPVKPIDVRHEFGKACQQAGITDFRWHDLRHTAASYLAMNGASLAEIAEILGHKTLAMVKRYAHLSEAHTAAVVERMNARIFGQG